MHIAFVAPAPDGVWSRADRYIHALADALRADGHATDIVDAAAWRRIGPETRMVVDARLLGALVADTDALIARGAVGLVHDVASLASGSEDQDIAVPHTAASAFYGRLHRIVVAGTAAGEHLQTACGVRAEALRLVLPGTPDAPRSTGSGGPRCDILAIDGEDRDSHDLLLSALARLFDLDWHLAIIGQAGRDPPDVAATKAAATTTMIAGGTVADRITRTGPLDGAALQAAWQGADLFAAATSSDGYATPVAEALRRGIPVAVTADERARALVGPDMGAVCAPGDRDTLSKSLRRMIFDTDLRRSMADAAWTRGQALPDWPTQARAFADALRG